MILAQSLMLLNRALKQLAIKCHDQRVSFLFSDLFLFSLSRTFY